MPLDGTTAPARVVWAPQPGQQHKLVTCPYMEILFGGARGGGKRLDITTVIPVPISTSASGFKTMGTLKPGDYVFSPRGEPVRVTWVSPIDYAPRTYEVEFDTGEIILADGEHLWHTMNKAERVTAMKADPEWRARRRATRGSRALADPGNPWVIPALVERNRARGGLDIQAPTGGVRTTDQIAATLTVQNGREINHSVAVTAPIELPDAALPIDPYLFGVWLGDGRANSGSVGMSVADMDSIAISLPTPTWASRDARYKTPFVTVRFDGLTTRLRSLGVWQNKHIPMQYLRASVAQRIALLQGILDTDGHCDARGQIEIGLSDRRLADGVHDLLSGLGLKATMRTRVVTLKGKVHKPSHRLKFMAPFPAFQLPRKLARQKTADFRDTVGRRYIVDVRNVSPVQMRCIKVDHPDGLFLVGRTMITTHNTDGVLGKWAVKAQRYGVGFNGVFFRHEMPQADDLIERAKEIYIPLGAEWREQPRQFRMPGGGRVRFRPLENVVDAAKYQGQNLTDCAVEEAGNFADPKPIDMLFGALRSKGGVPVQLILTANPGGVGQQWIKARYIDPAPRGMTPLVRKLPNGAEHRYIYIPSRIQDNRILLANDPTYINRLHLVGSPELVRAWLEGDWNVIAGAFFPEFSAERHIIAPRELPEHWARFRSFDWGSARPFAVHWWAVSDGSIPDIARGCLVCYREWYGMKPNEPNVGLRMTAEQVAEGIRDRERDDPKPASGMMVGVADPAIFAEDGGPSIAARMTQAARVVFRPADNKRVPQRGAMGGWDQLRSRLVGDGDGKPMIVFFSTARDIIRTLPALQHDPNRAEDVDCWVAGTMVSTPHGPRAIETIEPCDLVDTPLGPRPVLRSYRSGTTETVRATLSDGRVLEGTPHHKIMISGIGLVALADLKCHMTPIERIIWQSALSTTVSFIRGMRDGFTTIRTALILARTLAQASIVKCGLMPVAKFLPVGMSIIGTTTTTTMNYPILSVSHPEITRGSTSKSAWRAILVNNSRSGVAQMPDAQRSETMHARWSSARLNGNSRALIVRLLLLRDILIKSTARASAPNSITDLWSCVARSARRLFGQNETPKSRRRPVHIAAVGRSVERMPVYNLTVADAHLFYANGVLSSNTESEDHAADSCRYAMMSRPFVRDMERQKPRDSWDAAFNRDAEELRDWRVT